MTNEADRRGYTDTDHLIQITVDAGVYRWLRDVVAAKQRHAPWTPSSWYPELLQRAGQQLGLDAPEPEKRRVITRRR